MTYSIKLSARAKRSLRKSALFVTHDVREALMMATRIALLDEGQLVLEATPSEFRASRMNEARAFLACLEEEWENHDQRAGE